MITFGIFDFLILIIGWVILWFIFIPEDFKQELGFMAGFLIMLCWFIAWIVLFPIMHFHFAISLVRIL